MCSDFSQKLNEVLAAGSKKYYDYLKETGKGLILFDVTGIARIFEDAGKKCLYRLRLDKKLKSLEMLMVQVEKESRSTDSRVSTLAVIGCTVDTYIGYFSLRPHGESPDIPAFDRIFLDEAGYCPLAKAATLFAAGVPVTFLGDHFQLPPVCEADDEWIRGNGRCV
ncbi:hypothetical protein FACS1894211_12560 [Clostridia bacterium]|nr:hypothetical protein FACS1894211_12560 [Clostridia bacterium]